MIVSLRSLLKVGREEGRRKRKSAERGEEECGERRGRVRREEECGERKGRGEEEG